MKGNHSLVDTQKKRNYSMYLFKACHYIKSSFYMHAIEMESTIARHASGMAPSIARLAPKI
jgi:hypothetical protein